MAIDSQLLADLRQKLSDPSLLTTTVFSVIQELCRLVSSQEDDPDVQELILRALENRECLGTSAVVLIEQPLFCKFGWSSFLRLMDLVERLRRDFYWRSRRPRGLIAAPLEPR